MESSTFEVKQSLMPGVGLGLFSKQRVHKGDFLIEYTGVRIPTKEAQMHRGRYLFEIEGTPWTIDAEPSHSLAKYINHSCAPNAEARVEDEHINIYAVRAVGKGEEVTIDYGDEYFDEFIKPYGCKCGAPVHRS